MPAGTLFRKKHGKKTGEEHGERGEQMVAW